jgi:hypothetical protein
MLYVGFALLGGAVIAAIIGLLQRMKMTSILAAPFKKTGEITANPGVADAKGNVSAEGGVSAEPALIAPCSEKACVYYEVKIERLWEKTVKTENGTKTEKGKDTLETRNQGQIFNLDDGSGPVKVDGRENISGDMVESYSQTKSMSFGSIKFGKYEVNVSSSMGDKRTTGLKATEQMIPADGRLFVMGRLEDGTIKSKSGMLGKLLLSTRGRDKLIGATKRNMIIGFVLGILMLPPGIYFSLTGKPPSAQSDFCVNMQNSLTGTCLGRITTQQGISLPWTVTMPGAYSFVVAGTGTDAMNRLWPQVTVYNPGGQVVMTAAEGNGNPVQTAAVFAAGVYTILINDAAVADWAERMKGGVGFSLDIKAIVGAPSTAPLPAPTVSTPPQPSAAGPASPAGAAPLPAAQ